MFWIILAVAGIILAIIVSSSAENRIWDGPIKCFLAYFALIEFVITILCLIVGFGIGSSLGEVSSLETYESKKIILSPILTSHIDETNDIYVSRNENTYLYHTDKSESLTNENVTIIYTTEHPYLEIRSMRLASPLDRFFFFFKDTHYTFFIPENSLTGVSSNA